MLSAVYPLEGVGEAALQVHHNEHEGKIGVLCLAPDEGLGIDDPEKRERIGEDKITHLPPPRRLNRRRRHGKVAMARMLLTEIDHVAIAVSDLEAAIDYYQRAFGATVDHREVVESDGVEEALLKVAESYMQLAHPDSRRLPGGQGDREAGRGPAPRRLPGGRLRRGAGSRWWPRAPRPIDEAPRPGQPRHDRRLHPPQGQLRHADRARRGAEGIRRTLIADLGAPLEVSNDRQGSCSENPKEPGPKPGSRNYV